MLVPLLPPAFPSPPLAERFVQALDALHHQLVPIARYHTSLWREFSPNIQARGLHAVARDTFCRLSTRSSSKSSPLRPFSLLSHIAIVEKTTTLPLGSASHGCKIVDGLLLPCRLAHVLPPSTESSSSFRVLVVSGTLDVSRVRTSHSVQAVSRVIAESDEVQRSHVQRVVAWLRSLQIRCVFLQWGLSSALRDALHQAHIGVLTHILADNLERVALYTGAQILTHIPLVDSPLNVVSDVSSPSPSSHSIDPPLAAQTPSYIGFLDSLTECSVEMLDVAEETFVWLQRHHSPFPFVSIVASGVCSTLSHMRSHAVENALIEEAEYFETAQCAQQHEGDVTDETKALFVLGGGAIHVALATALKRMVAQSSSPGSPTTFVLQRWTEALLQVPLALAEQWTLPPLPTLHTLQTRHEGGEGTWGIFFGQCTDLRQLTLPIDTDLWIPLPRFLRLLRRLTEWLILIHQIDNIVILPQGTT